MTYKEKIEYLKQFSLIEKEISDLMDFYKNKVYGIGASSINDMPIAIKTNNFDFIGGKIAGLEQLQEYLNKITNNLYLQILDLEKNIQQLKNPIEKDILRKKYINNMTHNQISIDINYSYTSVRRLHKRAVYNLQL